MWALSREFDDPLPQEVEPRVGEAIVTEVHEEVDVVMLSEQGWQRSSHPGDPFIEFEIAREEERPAAR
jgi:hypothetical protein